jgi:hypothetical protein
VLFQRPFRIIAGAGHFVVYDHGTRSLWSFSAQGQLRWQLGRAGAAPGEFRGVASLRRDDAGRIWALDPTQNRITIISDDGRVLRVITPAELLGDIVPLHAGSFIGATALAQPYLALVDSLGAVRRRFAVPTEHRGRSPIATQVRLQPLDSRRVLAASKVTDHRFITSLTADSVESHRGPVAVPFPTVEAPTIRNSEGKPERAWRPARSTRYTTLATALSAGKVWLLQATAAPQPMRTVDIYSADARTYLGSVELPVAVEDITEYSDDCLLAIVNEPEPHVEKLCVKKQR